MVGVKQDLTLNSYLDGRGEVRFDAK